MKDLYYDLKTSVTIVQDCLILTLPNEMTDDEIRSGNEQILIKVNSSKIHGTIFDLSNVSMLDSYAFTLLRKTSEAISLMGITIVWIGLRPGIVSSLLDLDVNVKDIKTALNLEHALKVISESKGVK